jgi:hypothetical protein
MLLITELVEDVKYITEGEGDKKNLFIEGIFLQAGVKNRNGRMYDPAIMEREVARYMKEAVGSRRAYGELGHPSGPQINLDRVSHLIVGLQREGNNWIGKAKITDTPMGNIARGLINDGAALGVSSRGLGSLKPVSWRSNRTSVWRPRQTSSPILLRLMLLSMVLWKASSGSGTTDS